MARYKDVENIRKLFDNEYKSTRKLINEGETHLDNLAEGFSEATRVLDMLPAADVVPKSEVEEMMIGKANSLCAKFLIEEQEGRGKALMAEHDREVAREIFEEIEKESSYCVASNNGNEIYETKTYTISALKFDELKKKYTEGE